MARSFAGLMLMRIIGETHSAVKKIQQKQGREIIHLDKPILRKQSILKTPFQNPTSLERRAPRQVRFSPGGVEARFWLEWGRKALACADFNKVPDPRSSVSIRRKVLPSTFGDFWQFWHSWQFSLIRLPIDVPSRTEAPPCCQRAFDAHWCAA
jgi:hypothetical protein